MKEDLTGKKFGKLLVLNFEGIINGRSSWNCMCDCGEYKIVIGKNLKNNNTKSCGCLKSENASNITRSHNMSKTRLYSIYRNMKNRCYNPKGDKYIHYGGRGIQVCDRWMASFENFYIDMGSSYYDVCDKINEENVSLERIDVNGNYEPNNCTWIHINLQKRNKRGTIYTESNNKKITIAELSEEYNISYSRLYYANVSGKNIEELFGKK